MLACINVRPKSLLSQSRLNQFRRTDLGAENLDHDEVTIISSVLELSEKSVESIMTPIKDVYTLSSEQILDQATIDNIVKEGYSRVPIYSGEKDNFIGMLL